MPFSSSNPDTSRTFQSALAFESHHVSAFRIAGYYLLAGLTWIGVSDFTLALNGGLTASGIAVSITKGVAFVILSTVLVFWLCRREYRRLTTSSSLLRAVVEGSSDAIYVKDTQGRYLLVNNAAAQFFGRKESEILGYNDIELLGRQNGKQVMATDRSIIAGKKDINVEESLEFDGVTRIFHTNKVPLLDVSGAIAGVIGVSRNITDRKAAEARLREQELLVREAAEMAKVGGWWVDPVTMATDWTPEVANIYGLDLDSTPTITSAFEYLDPVQRVVLRSAFEDAMKYGKPHDLELQLTTADGEKKWVRTICRPIVESGRVVRVRGSLQDITDRKRAEIDLRASDRQLRLALEAAHAVAFMWDIPSDKVIRYFSNETALPVTAKASNLNGFRQRVHPVDLSKFDKQLNACLANGAEYRNEYRIVRDDLTTVYMEDFGILDRAADGTPLCLTGLAIDITDRVAATQALRSSEERLQEAAQVAGFGVFEHDHRNEQLFWSNRLREIYGIDQQSAANFTSFLELIHPSDRDRIASEVRRAHDPNGNGRFDVEYCLIRRSDGQLRWLATQSQTQFEGEGQDRRPVRTVGATIDVTEARHAAEALRASESRYKHLVDVMPTAVFVHADNKILFGNPALLRMLEINKADELAALSPFDLVHPSCHELLFRRQEEMRQSHAALPGCELLAVRRDGRTVPVYVVAAPVEVNGKSATLVALSDLTERERAAALLRSVLDSVGDAIITIDSHGIVTSTNRATERLFGYAGAELLGNNVIMLMPESIQSLHDDFVANYLRTNVPRVIGIGREVQAERKDGTIFPAELTVSEFERNGEREFTGVIRDITARRQLEEQFRQAQKMEAVGRLAGGVAHDFNNLLTVINCYAELLLSDMEADDPVRGPLNAIHDAGDRAARLTEQLLAFSRKSMLEPRVVDLNELVVNSAALIRRLIGEDVTLAVKVDSTPIKVMLDPGQIEQLLMNLAINARDAMPTGGQLTIEIQPVECPMEVNQSSSTQPDRNFALLRVTDTGCGMSPEIKEKIFEPFFTTKGLGKGTGLGLAVVHGIIQQSGGSIAVDSEVGLGTTFRILIPATASALNDTVAKDDSLAPRGGETVLVVEDEEALRAIVRVALERQGYSVLTASCGNQACQVLQDHLGKVELLLTDVIMPEMSGRELAAAARALQPGLRVIFMSGYTDDALDRYGLDGQQDPFIQKPFSSRSLAQAIRETLDRPE